MARHLASDPSSCDCGTNTHPVFISGAPSAPVGDYGADIVILSLDRADETIAAIRSALSQTGVSRHVFIVDQGSQPANLALLATAVANRADATLIALDHNYGVAGGRNRGSALGHGRVIFGLDNDAEFASPTTLAQAVAALDADTALAAIGCRIVLHSNNEDDVSSWGYPAGLLAHSSDTFDAVTFVGAGHAIRRTAWDNCRGYDGALHFCWEELDFCLRAIERGWRIRYHGDIVVRHKVSPERRVAWSGTRWFHYVRNRLYIGRKWSSGWLPLLPRFLFYLLKGARNGLLPQTLRAFPAAIAMASGIVSHCPSPAARDYLRMNDSAYRESWLIAAWHEALRRLPGQQSARAASRSLSSNGKIAGQSTR
jgi:GT2 family glycosyltransferase